MKRTKRNRQTLSASPRTIGVEGELGTDSASLDSLDAGFDYGFNEENPFEPEPIREVESICNGRVKCIHCGKIYGFCSTIEYELTLEKENTMLPAATSGQSQQSSGTRPTTRRQNGLSYIKPENLSSDKSVARILDVRVAEPAPEGTRNFSDIRVKIALKGATWLYGLRLNNPELAKLQSAFSLDENNWPGKEFYMFNEIDEFDGKIYMRVEPIITAPAARKKGQPQT